MKLNKLLLLVVGTALTLTACSKDWLEPKPLNPVQLVGSNKTEAYYENLRAYKKTDHQVMFGWFGNWSGVGASLQGSLAGLPDSVDFVSLWAAWQHPTEAMLEDLRYVQEVKGTRAVVAGLLFEIGDKITPSIPEATKEAYKKEGVKDDEMWTKWRRSFWGFTEADLMANNEVLDKAVVKYANALCDTIFKYGYDGFDLDAEPNYAQPFSVIGELWNKTNPSATGEKYPTLKLFLQTMSKRIGPMAETAEGRKKMLVVDGEPEEMPRELAGAFDYYIFQAYNDGRYPSSRRVENVVRELQKEEGKEGGREVEDIIKRCIFTVDFESGATTGGKGTLAQMVSFAAYQPTYKGKVYRKGGVGAYHLEYGYPIPIDAKDIKEKTGFDMSGVQGATYPWTRMAISIMNPIIK